MPWVEGDALTPTNLNNREAPVANVLDSTFTGTSDASLFLNALSSLSVTGGTILIPASTQTYTVASTLTLYPDVVLQGVGQHTPVIRYSGTGALFAFTGTTEAQGLNAAIRNVQLLKSSVSSGVGVQAQNFSKLFLDNVTISGFSVGVWAQYGIGLYLDGCQIISNGRGLLSGGSMLAGGIRSGSTTSAFMDTVAVSRCAFSANQYDITDDGTTYSLGGLTIRDSTFFEGGAVSGKSEMIHVANRKGAVITGNWFEEQQDGRTLIVLTNVDSFGTAQLPVRGAAISGNAFLQNANSGNAIKVENAEATTIFSNNFELGSSGNTVRAVVISDVTHQTVILPNSYIQWHDGATYPAPVTSSASSLHIVLDSTLTGDIGRLNVAYVETRGGVVTQETNTNLVRVFGGTNARIQLYPGGSSNSAFEIDNSPVNVTTPRLRLYTQGAVPWSLTSTQVLVSDGAAGIPSQAYSSETSLGWYRSGSSTMALSYGTINLNNAILSSVRTTNASGTSATVNDKELRIVAVSVSSAQLAFRSGNTTYLVNADATAL